MRTIALAIAALTGLAGLSAPAQAQIELSLRAFAAPDVPPPGFEEREWREHAHHEFELTCTGRRSWNAEHHFGELVQRRLLPPPAVDDFHHQLRDLDFRVHQVCDARDWGGIREVTRQYDAVVHHMNDVARIDNQPYMRW